MKQYYYLLAALIYVAFLIYNLQNGSQWAFDAVISLLFIGCLYVWGRLDVPSFVFANISLIVHNAGSFGLYGMTFLFLGYDVYVHLVGGAAAAFGLTRTHIRPLFFVLTLVITGGMIVELMEYGGSIVLGAGEGILFTGPGDGKWEQQYGDTMKDLFVNVIGALIGLALAFLPFLRKPFSEPRLNRRISNN